MNSYEAFLLIAFIVSIIVGIICMFVPKNPVVGVRISWAEYNDKTWNKTNRVTGVLLVLVGIASILSLLVLSSSAAEKIFLISLGLTIIVSLINARIIYNKEKRRRNQNERNYEKKHL